MSVPNDQGDVVIAPAVTPEGTPAQRRRAAAQRVREARDRLTSTTGTRPAFDYELLRLFAHNRLSASLVTLLLIGTVGFLSSLWISPVIAGTWTCAMLAIHGIIITKCRQFLADAGGSTAIRPWRLRFVRVDPRRSNCGPPSPIPSMGASPMAKVNMPSTRSISSC